MDKLVCCLLFVVCCHRSSVIGDRGVKKILPADALLSFVFPSHAITTTDLDRFRSDDEALDPFVVFFFSIDRVVPSKGSTVIVPSEGGTVIVRCILGHFGMPANNVWNLVDNCHNRTGR
jgi:hypothetical protein